MKTPIRFLKALHDSISTAPWSNDKRKDVHHISQWSWIYNSLRLGNDFQPDATHEQISITRELLTPECVLAEASPRDRRLLKTLVKFCPDCPLLRRRKPRDNWTHPFEWQGLTHMGNLANLLWCGSSNLMTLNSRRNPPMRVSYWNRKKICWSRSSPMYQLNMLSLFWWAPFNCQLDLGSRQGAAHAPPP